MRIFISYRSTDRALVTQLVQDFEDLGYSDIWFDQELTGGHAWWDAILQNINQCDLFVFALTPVSLESEPCRREYQYATQQARIACLADRWRQCESFATGIADHSVCGLSSA
jgi:hypothetical protein